MSRSTLPHTSAYDSLPWSTDYALSVIRNRLPPNKLADRMATTELSSKSPEEAALIVSPSLPPDFSTRVRHKQQGT